MIGDDEVSSCSDISPEVSVTFWLQFLFSLTLVVRDIMQTADDATAHKILDAVNRIHHLVVSLVQRRVKGNEGGCSDNVMFELVNMAGCDRGVGFLVEDVLGMAAEAVRSKAT